MRILLVRLRLIGDVVFTTPAVRALRRAYPDATMTYLVETDAAPVVRGNPHLDEVLAVSRRTGLARLADDLRLGRALRRRRFDLVVDFHGGPRSAWLTWLSGARRRLGYTIAGRTWMYTEAVARPRALRPRHSVQNQWDLLAPLGIAPPEPARDAVEMPEHLEARDRVNDRLRRADVTPSQVLIVLHVSAGNPFRRWPAAAFAELTARLVAADAARRVVLTAGPSEAGAAEAIARSAQDRLPPQRRPHVLRCGEFDLAELRSLVARAALFIGGDSGPLHIAGTSQTPVVGLYGPTLPVRSAPWRDPRLVTLSVEPGPLDCRPCDQRVCAPGDFRCLAGISATAVADAAEQALGRAARLAPAHADTPVPEPAGHLP